MQRLNLIVVIIILNIAFRGVAYATIIDAGSYSGIPTFIDTSTGIQWANVSIGYNLTPLQMLNLLPPGFHLASRHMVGTLLFNFHEETPEEASDVATLTGALTGSSYWLGGITSDPGGSNPGDYLAIGWEFDDLFFPIQGSTGLYSCSQDSSLQYIGIWATYDNSISNPVPEPSSIILFIAGIGVLTVLCTLNKKTYRS